MSDAPPLIFRKHLGQLRPANAAAEKAMRDLEDGPVRVRITRSRGNTARNAAYWSILNVAAPMLDEIAPGLTVELLHQVLKDRRGLYRLVHLPSGEAVKDYESISFAKMPENERAEYISWAVATLAKWLGVSEQELREASKDG